MHNIGIRLVLIVLVSLPLLVAFALGLLVVQALEERIEDRMQEDIELIARTLQAPMSRSLQSRSDRELDLALWSAYSTGRVYGVYVYDDKGELVAAADQDPALRQPRRAAAESATQEAGGEYASSVDGRELYSYFVPLYATSGQVIGLLEVTRDAGAMRTYLAQLRRNGVWLLLMGAMLFGVLVYVGHYLAIGRPLQSLKHTMDAVAAGDSSVRAEERGPGELRQLATRFNGMLEAIIEKDADLAAKREQQEKLEARLRERAKYAMVGRLASGVAHELGTPLAVVDAHAQRLARIAEPGTQYGNISIGIRTAVDRMSSVIRQLLGFGRASHAALADVSLRQLVSLAATDTRERCRAEGTRVDVQLPDGDARVQRADFGRLREALGHLLRNAAQAAPGGTVRIGWRLQQGDPALFVEDSGPGIDEAVRERMFDPFFTTKPPGEGSGLGLAIVLGVAADHRAELIVYRSEDLGGAAFEMRFRNDG